MSSESEDSGRSIIGAVGGLNRTRSRGKRNSSRPQLGWERPLAPGVGLEQGCTDSSRGVSSFQTAASVITRAVPCNKPHIRAYISHLTDSVSLDTADTVSVMGERGITLQSVEKGK